jgi:hypothetical protein
MVLHHVAQRAGGLVEGAALLDAQFFGDGDLDVGNVFAPPQRLEQRIAKAQRKQVLHRRLAQVVVDAKHLLFAENLAHRAVDGAVGRQVVAQRLFQHHAGVGGVQPDGGHLLADGGEQGGAVATYITTVSALRSPAAWLGQAGVVVGLGQVHAHKISSAAKRANSSSLGRLASSTLSKRDWIRLRYWSSLRSSRPRPMMRPLGQGAVAKGLEQGRHQFAPGQIAGAAKQRRDQRTCYESYIVT